MVPWQPVSVEMKSEVGAFNNCSIFKHFSILGHMLSMISLGVAGYSPNSAHLWKDTCASMKKDVCSLLVLFTNMFTSSTTR